MKRTILCVVVITTLLYMLIDVTTAGIMLWKKREYLSE